jgi:hypothetical protein
MLKSVQTAGNFTLDISIHLFYTTVCFRKYFITNYDTHNLQTRQSNNLFPPTSTLMYQKGVYFTDIKLFNELPSAIKETILIENLF